MRVVISPTTSCSIRMSWFLWFPNNAQLLQILYLHWIQIISSFLLCYAHIVSSIFSDSTKADNFLTIGVLTADYFLFKAAFSASLIKAKFLGYFSADSLLSHSILNLIKKQSLLVFRTIERSPFTLFEECIEALSTVGMPAFREQTRNEVVLVWILSFANKTSKVFKVHFYN